MRKDGFVSLDAAEMPGAVTTKLLTTAPRPLLINADAGHGSVIVEVLDHTGKVWPGDSANECLAVITDAIDQPVQRKKQMTLPETADGIRLRFVISNASLYSFG